MKEPGGSIKLVWDWKWFGTTKQKKKNKQKISFSKIWGQASAYLVTQPEFKNAKTSSDTQSDIGKPSDRHIYVSRIVSVHLHCYFKSSFVARGIYMLNCSFIAEISRAKRASGAPWVRKWSNLPIRENLVITWPYTERPSVRTTGIPM